MRRAVAKALVRSAAAYTTLEDLFADLFGGFVAPHADQGDLQHVVVLTFEEPALTADAGDRLPPQPRGA